MDLTKKHVLMRLILLMAITVFTFSSCSRSLEIIKREVTQLPHRTIYIAGVDDSIDMEGLVVTLHSRGGRVVSVPYEDTEWVIVEHEIDFLIPGEYEVFLYWGEFFFGSMSIQVVPE